MTNYPARLFALVVSLIVLFAVWAAIATHPWSVTTAAAPEDKRLAALVAREKQLKHRALIVQRIVKARWAVYSRQLAGRERKIVAARTRYLQQLAAARQAAAVYAALPRQSTSPAASPSTAEPVSGTQAVSSSSAVGPSTISSGSRPVTTSQQAGAPAPSAQAPTTAVPLPPPPPSPPPPPPPAIVNVAPVTSSSSSAHA
jgi:hypothetical protein